METLVRIAALCLVASVTASLLRRGSAELGLLLALATALLGGALLLGAIGELAALGDELVKLTGLAPSLFAPLVKVTAIALLVRVGGALCRDAGQSALASVLDTAGAICAMGCALPLIGAVVDLIRGWI